MRNLPRHVGDVLLGLFAVAVLIGAVVVVKQSGAPASATSSLTPIPDAVSTPSASARPTHPAASPSPTASASLSTVVLAGPDLAKLRALLATKTGSSIKVVAGRPPEVLAPGALDGISRPPRAVVLEILAGSLTSARTAGAITAVEKKWPGVQVVVVGPFSSADRKSAGAAKAAAGAAKATFLDPVALKWRTADTSPTLSAADLSVVADKLAAALA